MINYGPDLDNNNMILNFATTYSNRVAMDADVTNKNILVGSYVLVDYDTDSPDTGTEVTSEDFNANFTIDNNVYNKGTNIDPSFGITGYDSTIWQKRYENNSFVYKHVADLNVIASLGKKYLNKQAILTTNSKGWIADTEATNAGDNIWIQTTINGAGALKISHIGPSTTNTSKSFNASSSVKIPTINVDNKGHVVSISEGSAELATQANLNTEINNRTQAINDVQEALDIKAKELSDTIDAETDRAMQAEADLLASIGDDYWVKVETYPEDSDSPNKLKISHIGPKNDDNATQVVSSTKIPTIRYDSKGHVLGISTGSTQLATQADFITLQTNIKTSDDDNTWIEVTPDNTNIGKITVKHIGPSEADTNKSFNASSSVKIPTINIDSKGHVVNISEEGSVELATKTNLDQEISNRTQAINDVQTTLNTKAQELSSTIDAEIDRATQAESDIETRAKQYTDSTDQFSTTINTVNAFGGIPADTDLNGKTTNEILKMLLYPYVIPVIQSVTIEPSTQLFEMGSTAHFNKVEVKVVKKSENIKKIELLDNEQNILNSTEVDINKEDTVVFNNNGQGYDFSKDGKFIVKVWDNKAIEDDTIQPITKSTSSWKFIYPYYYGICDKNAIINAELIAGLRSDLTEKSKTKTYKYIPTTEQRAIVAYPSNYGELIKIEDENGFDNTNNFTKYTISIENKYNKIQEYYVYVSGVFAAENSFTFIYGG